MEPEQMSLPQLRQELTLQESIVMLDLPYDEVASRQIMSALLRTCSLGGVPNDSYTWRVLKAVANEARRRGLLFNPNPYSRQTYSAALQANCDNMRPSRHGWEMTKGILMKHVVNSTTDLRVLILKREQNWLTPQSRPPAPGRLLHSQGRTSVARRCTGRRN